ncbi:VWA domain-containing protein [Flexithrix dorotheae]|uniref:VWA domain-containing protein n=1 Tax=Flexithrix dorotheae TaxID=70993 RepID=UPI0003755C8B|nr:VWA domain-containing protein [Flexithrix dorotheae]
MFRFEHSDFLYGLILIPILVILFWLEGRMRKKAIRSLGSLSVIKQLMPEYSRTRPVWKNLFIILSVLSLIIAVANPQVGSKMEIVKRKGVEIIIAIDVSNSMLAEDIRPNRLEKAKQSIAQLVKRLHNDKLGLIVFAGDAYTQLPITTDYSAARMFLRSVKTNIVPVQGTAIGKAIELGMNSFSKDETKNKALIVITDGENHEDDALEMAKKAAEAGIIVNTIGMGQAKGAPIPVYNNYGQKDFRKDNQGNVIVTKLNETMLRQIAQAGNGTFIRATNSGTGLNILFDKINELEKKEFESKLYTDYEDGFPIFISLALFFLLLEFLILPRKNKWMSKIDLFKFKV